MRNRNSESAESDSEDEDEKLPSNQQECTLCGKDYSPGWWKGKSCDFFFHYRERTFMIIKLQLRTKSLAALSQTGLLYCAFLVLNFG